MTISSSGNSSLDKISSSYQSSDTEKTKKDDALGRDAFLTMLVAQLQNQDPLNPMDGTDFSAQLAQFSQLEQLINLNDSMDSLAASFGGNSEKDSVSYIGKQVTGNVDTMTVDEGAVSGGFYSLSKAADVMISIADANGKTIKTLYPGQKATGSHLISWNGTDNNGDAVKDGSYTYTVLANTGSGYTAVPSSITGTVSGVAYNNGKAYLVVQGILLDLESVTAVSDIAASTGSESALSYLGKTVTSNSPIILVEDGDVSGDELNFKLDAQKEVTLKIYDIYDELVKTITVSAANTVAGENKVEWNGLSDSGYKAEDGLYYYTVKADSSYAKTPVSEEISGIKYVNGAQYLVMKDSGRLISLSAITGVN